MSTINAVRRRLPGDTQQGKMFKQLGNRLEGLWQSAAINFSGNGVNGDKITLCANADNLGGTVFQLWQCSTDSTWDAGSEFNASSSATSLTITGAHTFRPGSVFGLGSEYLRVLTVNGAVVTVQRGAFGSTAATQATGSAILIGTTEQPPLPLVVGGTLTNSTIRPLVVKAFNYLFALNRGGSLSPRMYAENGSTGAFTILREYSLYGKDNIDGLTNGTVADFVGGTDGSNATSATYRHVITSGEASGGTVTFYVAPGVKGGDVLLLDQSAAAVGNGVDEVDLTIGFVGQLVTITEGTTAWAADDILVATLYW